MSIALGKRGHFRKIVEEEQWKLEAWIMLTYKFYDSIFELGNLFLF